MIDTEFKGDPDLSHRIDRAYQRDTLLERARDHTAMESEAGPIPWDALPPVPARLIEAALGLCLVGTDIALIVANSAVSPLT